MLLRTVSICFSFWVVLPVTENCVVFWPNPVDEEDENGFGLLPPENALLDEPEPLPNTSVAFLFWFDDPKLFLDDEFPPNGPLWLLEFALNGFDGFELSLAITYYLVFSLR